MPIYSYEYFIGFFLVFSLADRNSFEDVRLFVSYIRNSAGKKAWIMLVGNKCDLLNQREVSYEEAKNLADELDILYVEVSAKTGYNIECAIRLLYEAVYNTYNPR